jgi:hypothetical protein
LGCPLQLLVGPPFFLRSYYSTQTAISLPADYIHTPKLTWILAGLPQTKIINLQNFKSTPPQKYHNRVCIEMVDMGNQRSGRPFSFRIR